MKVIVILSALFVIGAIIAAVVILTTKNRNNEPSAPVNGTSSYFDGSTLQWIGWRILTNIITTITLGIAYPWAMCMMTRWEVKHTVINGRRLKFNGNGAQLFGKYILWAFLTIITLGIYSIWFGLGMEKWRVKHTVYADDRSPVESRFTGGAGGWFLNHLVLYLLSLITLGIAVPWANVRIMKWKARNTVIGGSPLVFEGRGGQLFVKYLLCALLAPITLGIYLLFFPVILLKWQYKHTVALYRTAPIVAKSRAHEEAAIKDYAKIRLAANDTELSMVKNGFNGNESQEELETLSQNGNPYAKYALALKLKGENIRFEGESLELLKASSDAKYHPAMFNYASYIESTDEKISLLEESAKLGNSDAPWLLKQLYEQKASSGVGQTNEQKLETLTKAAYWFKVAIELETAEAVNSKAEYEKLCEKLAILHCSDSKNNPSAEGNAVVIAAIVAGAVVLIAAIATVLALFLLKPNRDAEPARVQTIAIASGDGQICTLEKGELFRYSDSKYKNYDFAENNFEYESSPGISVKGYLGDTAYYDVRTKTLFIDFGISPDSTVNYGDNFSAYLVSENNLRYDGTCDVFSGAVEAGERIISVPCDLPSNIKSTKIHVVIFNDTVSERAFASAETATNGKNTLIGENTHSGNSDKWVMDVYSKRVNIVYEPINNENPSENGGNTVPDESDNQGGIIGTPDNSVGTGDTIPNTLSTTLIGNWVTAYRNGNYIDTMIYTFNPDGSFGFYHCDYIDSSTAPGLFGEGATGWQVTPMGHPSTYGTYTINDDGSTLTLCYTGDDIESFDSPVYRTARVHRITESEMDFSEDNSPYTDNQRTFLKNVQYSSVEELCLMLGVDIS